ncbi:MAG: hypothetical protein C0467_04345 [Planctomycetaceae bacterium]|nr:hypothetical protein [Planctomycetaceae bacterium]
MLSNVIRTTTAAAFLMTAGVLSAQPPVRVEAQPEATSVATYRAKQILGAKILIQGNTAIGTVDDIIFDSAGNMDYLVVVNEGKFITVPWDATKFDLKTQTALLNITPEIYKMIPTYTGTTYPDFWAPTYRVGVYKYYGLSPRELRRIDRRIP